MVVYYYYIKVDVLVSCSESGVAEFKATLNLTNLNTNTATVSPIREPLTSKWLVFLKIRLSA